MLTSSELIERVRVHVAKEKGIERATDYAVAKALHIRQQAMTERKKGNTKGMDDETAIRAADLLGLDRAYVLASIQAERAERLHLSSAETWRKIAETFTRAAAVASFFVLAVVKPDSATAGKALQGTIASGSEARSLYIMSKRFWRILSGFLRLFRVIPRPVFA